MQIRARMSMSADGYVTTPGGWPALTADPAFVSGQSHGFPEFIEGCEAALMGRTTFEPALTNDRWPWPNLNVFVLGSQRPAGTPDHVVSDSDPARLLEKLRPANQGREVHLVGGPRTLETFRAVGALDKLELLVLPLLLGGGMQLTPSLRPDAQLTFERARALPGGSVEIVYAVSARASGLPARDAGWSPHRNRRRSTSDHWAMTSFITRDELRAALDSVTVVDALPPAPYGQRHLPGALNLVEEDSDEHLSSVLPDTAAAIVAYSTDANCTRGPDLAARLEALGYSDVRTYRDGIEDWVGAGLPVERPTGVTLDLADLALAWLFEGHRRAGVDISMFVVRTLPGRAVELHVHPYAETFLLLEGRGRWTRGDDVVELEPEQMIVVPPDTPHGFRNIGDVPLLVVSVHERGTLRQTFLRRDPA